MNIRTHTFVRIIFLTFSWKCGLVSGSETTMKTWKQAVLDCYGNNSFLESNATVLKQYMVNHTKVNDSIWVGSFQALLPWIEIRGCYNIPLTCNSVEKDETNAANLQLCQVKCMKRRYFAFNQKNERCVCFDEHDIVKKETDNARFCQEFIDRVDSNTHAVVYKVFDRSLNLAGYNHDCLFYQCHSNGSKLTFSTKECYTSARSYCRDGRRAVGPVYQLFQQYRDTCEKNHFTYPLLYSENPVKLCNVSDSIIVGIDVWVGVYRQKLYIDNSDKTVLEDFNKIEQFISQCNYLPTNDALLQADNCSVKHFYKCSSDTLIKIQKDTNASSTSTHLCRSVGFPDASTSRSIGMIIGIVISISVIVLIILVILAVMYRRTYAKKQGSLKTAIKKDRNTNYMDNNTVISDYQQLDNVDDVQKMTQAYDQLHVPHNLTTNDQANTSFSREENSKHESIVDSTGINTNTIISEYEELHKSNTGTNTQAYDQLNVTRAVKTDPTNFFKNESIVATAVTSEYELLDNAKTDKSVNVYDQLDVAD